MTLTFKHWLTPWLIASLTLCLLTLSTCSSPIAKDITHQVQSILDANKISEANIDVNGRDVSILIDAIDRPLIDPLTKNIMTIDAVRTVDFLSRPLPPLQQRAEEILASYENVDWVEINVDKNNIVKLTGQSHKTLPDEMLSQINALENVADVINQAQLIDSPSVLVEQALQPFNVPWLSLTVNNDKGLVRLSGKTLDNDLKLQLISTINNITGVNKVDDQIIILESYHAAGCQAKVDQTLLTETILFDFNRTEINQQSQPLLNTLATILKQCPDTLVEVSGHTDNTGDAFVNQHFSQERATSVVNELIELGVQPERLTARGYGESQPVTSNATVQGRQKNRRIEFVISAISDEPKEDIQ